MLDPHRRIVRDGYDTVSEQYLAARSKASRDLGLLPELIERLSVGDRILDAGCGAGIPVMAHLVESGLKVVGLDFSRAQLQLARSLLPGAATAQADLAALPFRGRSFRAVVSYYAIIHVPRRDHDTIYREVHRVLQRGGFALLCLGANDLPEDHDPESWLGTPMYWSHYDAPTNLRMLREVGFQVAWYRLVADPIDQAHHLFVLATRP